MIQFNLLPDVKIEFIKARRLKRLVGTIAVLVAAGSLAILVLLVLAVQVLQAKHLRNLSADIKSDSQKLQNIEELDKILTIQNQLNHLTELHAKKAATSRIYPYLSQITPVKLKYESIEINFTENTMELIGKADTIKTVNQFIDTLKFTRAPVILVFFSGILLNPHPFVPVSTLFL